MPYEAEISRVNPCAFLLLLDQSGSMADMMEGGYSKARAVADAINRVLQELVMVCSKSEGIRDYFDVGVLTYGANGVRNAFQGVLGERILNHISVVADNPLRIEERTKKIPDGAGGLVEHQVRFPIWFDPVSSGGTPMREAIRVAGIEIGKWCECHPTAFPPAILNITDGEPTDGDPEPVAETVKQLHTEDGNVLLFNLHISSRSSRPILFADDEEGLPDEYAKRLFRMSSVLPPKMLANAEAQGFKVSERSRGYVYNADIEALVTFLEIGTRPANLR